MGRHSEGWVLVCDPRTGILSVRFTLDGVRKRVTTGERDGKRATIIAARIYAEHVGRLDAKVDDAPPAAVEDLPARASALVALSDVADDWLKAIKPLLDETTVRGYGIYIHTHWRFFKSIAELTALKIDAYIRARLAVVRRKTLLKEFSALRRFLEWLVLNGYLATAPTVRSPPRTATGTVFNGGKGKKVRVDLTDVEAEAIISHLPVATRTRRHPAKAFFRVMWETGLRRGTLFELSAPDDYNPKRPTLRVREEIDKARFGRELPLSPAAREALDSAIPEDGGLIFPPANYRAALHNAAKAAGLEPERARHLSYHDWRHAALTHMASATTDLAGMAYLAGHKDVTTTAKYVHASLRAAERALAARRKK